MLKERYIFPAIFNYDEDGISIEFPDLPGCLPCGKTLEEAMKNAKEALGLHIYGMEQDKEVIPEPTPANKLRGSINQAVVLIDVFMPVVRYAINNKAVNKTVTLPRWLEAKAEEENINFSQVLKDALINILGASKNLENRK